jgi:hypothetical protein
MPGVPIHNRVLGNGVERRSLVFTFYPNGTNNSALPLDDPAGPTSSSDVASVVRNGSAGEFLVTLQYPVQRVLCRTADIQLAAVANLDTQFATQANIGTSTPATFLVRSHATGTPTDIAQGANNSIAVHLELELAGNTASLLAV